jgi:hypothetical protein
MMMNGTKISKKQPNDFEGRRRAGSGNPTSGWIYQGICNLYKIYTSMKILLPPCSK